MASTFWADISSWQRPVDASYPYPVLAFRVDWGGGIDDNARANWSHIAASSAIKAGIGYVVYKPGQSDAIAARVRGLFGTSCPGKLAFMVDMESGADFAGPGNHSTDANRLTQLLADYAGNPARVIGYANGGDWASCWPTRPAWLKRVVASYGTQNPGGWAWQFYGGMNYPTPAGYPRSCKPFGTSVDLNVCLKPLADVLADLGIGDDMALTAAESAQLATAAKFATAACDRAQALQTVQAAQGTALADALNRIAALQAQVAALSKQQASVQVNPVDVPVTGTVHIGGSK